MDSWGDGWTGGAWTWTDDDGTSTTGTVSYSTDTATVCPGSGGCGSLLVDDASAYSSEQSWGLLDSSGTIIASGGADTTAQVCDGVLVTDVECPPCSQGYDCDYWVEVNVEYTCALLESSYGCDCSGCSSCDGQDSGGDDGDGDDDGGSGSTGDDDPSDDADSSDCVDLPGDISGTTWTTNNNWDYGCDWFEGGVNRCNGFGDDNNGEGTANEKCCVCGGGRTTDDDGSGSTGDNDPNDDAGSDDTPTNEPKSMPCGPGSAGSSGKCQKCPRGRHTSKADEPECRECPVGRTANVSGSSTCEFCPSQRWTTSTGSVYCDACRGTYYLASSKRGSRQAKSWGAAEDKERDHCYPSEDIGNACCDCVEGADCDALQTTVESMVITEGWYRYSTTSAQVLKCSTPFACAGSKSANGTNDDDATTLCRAGFTGPMCHRCSPDHYRDDVTEYCIACSSQEATDSKAKARAGGWWVLPTVFGVVAFLSILLMVAVNRDGPVRDYWMEHEDVIMATSHHVTVAIVTFQLVCHIQSAVVFRGGAHFPEPFASIVRVAEVLTLDVFSVFRVSCMVTTDFNFSDKLLGITIASIVLVVGVICGRIPSVLYEGRFFDGYAMSFMFMVLYFTIPTTSSTIAKSFLCTEFLDGEGGSVSFMHADMTLSCDGRKYAFIKSYASLMMVIFPIGVPLAAFCLLYKRRHEIEERDTRLGGDDLKAIAFVFRFYSQTKWSFAILDIVRRLLPALMITLDKSFALLVALLTSILFTVIWRVVQPSWDLSSNRMGYATTWFIVICIIALVFATIGEDLETDGRFLSWVLVSARAVRAVPRRAALHCTASD
mmetsp:Transcript_69222/g.193662  ORF Transcript_69222/g.193662 Transcript_69222/m.193662 type:complete len:830 (+) Transcript_69222:756-3245(+)